MSGILLPELHNKLRPFQREKEGKKKKSMFKKKKKNYGT